VIPMTGQLDLSVSMTGIDLDEGADISSPRDVDHRLIACF
jgi:hypothetical protein